MAKQPKSLDNTLADRMQKELEEFSCQKSMDRKLPCNSLEMLSYIAKRCRELSISGINATKLEKLMYCCYGVSLTVCSYRLCGESPEAWQYGPVFPKTLRYMKNFGVNALAAISCNEVTNALPGDVVSAIDRTLEYFGRYSSDKLSAWSCLPGSPWSTASDNGKHLYEQIDDAFIRSYFEHHVLDMTARTEA